jgi:F-type H+-transporting ATPase subunit gamma
MASTQQIKARIKSVKNTKQITKAMEMVAASKMRRAQETTLASRDYVSTARQILAKLRELTDVSKHPLFVVRTVKSRIIIVITSDRGLAGAYNSNVLRQLAKELKSDRDNGITTKIITVGRQAAKFVAKVDGLDVIASYNSLPEKPTIADLASLLSTVKNAFVGEKIEDTSVQNTNSEKDTDNDVDSSTNQKITLSAPTADAIDILFTDFKSSVVQEVTQQRLLPAAMANGKIVHDLEDAVFEPSPELVLETISSRLVDVQLWQAYLESQASEQSSRMLAMKTASDNAGDLIDDLTLAANSARQSAITQELAEIVGGAEAMN